ncbi:hypothetical protein [Candidatus Uabimicrobium sp. HlEnr_7]|uniref:hypothetical protein n=1 Tax=Candidatus Uabimicrobium helgolandensis TaxID=3095367 RepID=UPI003555E129
MSEIIKNDELLKAINQNTKATNENTDELKKINKRFSLAGALNFFNKKENKT